MYRLWYMHAHFQMANVESISWTARDHLFKIELSTHHKRWKISRQIIFALFSGGSIVNFYSTSKKSLWTNVNRGGMMIFSVVWGELFAWSIRRKILRRASRAYLEKVKFFQSRVVFVNEEILFKNTQRKFCFVSPISVGKSQNFPSTEPFPDRQLTEQLLMKQHFAFEGEEYTIWGPWK